MVTKPRILEAVREVKGEQSVQLIDHLKKGDMAREAERLLEGTGWLPEPLRLDEVGTVGEPAIAHDDFWINAVHYLEVLPPVDTSTKQWRIGVI
jgi:hypothetical protein